MSRPPEFCILKLAPALLIGFARLIQAQDWTMQPVEIATRWAASVNPRQALSDYPRPQLVRAHWRNLNGLWQYSITSREDPAPARYEGWILVPYPLESALSGVSRPLEADQALWYRRVLHLAPRAPGTRTLLHFGAVDYQATVLVNGREVGAHSGGYESFTIDVTAALQTGDNELRIKVWDPTDTGPNPHGKQSRHPQGIWYTASSGIWQTVWLEHVPETYIDRLTLTPDVDHGALQLQVHLGGAADGRSLEAVVRSGAKVIARETLHGTSATLPIPRPRLWSPDDPFLYGLEVRTLHHGRVEDVVSSYFGLRKIEVRKDAAGHERIVLNGRYTYNLGVLDQGFWPDGLYTAPSDAALRFDLQAIKAMGFNTIRKHVKVEPERWYFHCDQLGLMVWQDMVPPANATAGARAAFEQAVQATLAQLHNHPSITTWVLFNEDFGTPYDLPRLSAWLKQQDPTRLLDAHSGPFDPERLALWARRLTPPRIAQLLAGKTLELLDEQQGTQHDDAAANASDLTDLHHYPDPRIPPAAASKARVLGEHGGIGLVIDGHLWEGLPGFSYRPAAPGQMARDYAAMVQQLVTLEGEGLTASIYTQPFDVEREQNGLITYDRAVMKIPAPELAELNTRLVPRARSYRNATAGWSLAAAEPTADAVRYEALLGEYGKGRRDTRFLRDLTVLAQRQKDQAHATEVGNALLSGARPPYSSETWRLVQAITRTARDRGFELLRAHAAEADAALGERAAEAKVQEVIAREEIEPALEQAATPDWSAMERTVAARYGPLGAQQVYASAILYFLGRADWPAVGGFARRYFESGTLPASYPVSLVGYVIFQHVAAPEVLDATLRALQRSVSANGTTHPDFDSEATALDTCANLLYRLGRRTEALEWQARAIASSRSRDPELADHLRKMQTGEPTW